MKKTDAYHIIGQYAGRNLIAVERDRDSKQQILGIGGVTATGVKSTFFSADEVKEALELLGAREISIVPDSMNADLRNIQVRGNVSDLVTKFTAHNINVSIVGGRAAS